jgi:beta-lactam-binding protein with PASTA domain/tRNA A-37 threonylcarbamoyl transferase component Bud32
MIGRLVDGRYQVRSRIARGGMATVYLATDLRLERRVAIKVMHGHLADDESFKQRFIQEARSAARLAHPNVVNVFDQGQDADSAYLVMEYLPGITLRDLLQEYGSLTSEQTLDISEAVLSGLAAAHKAGIVHRDLKPENVLLADDGRIKIGLARAATANTATGAALLGTVAYLSPELVTRGIADTRSDIYAVGIMMYEMLTGEQPFRGEQPMQVAYQHANDAVPTPSTVNPRVPAELDELVLWATARDPEHRPRDARTMLDQLHDTEALIKTALPDTATGAQRTVVMPSATPPVSPASEAETQVLASRVTARAAAAAEVPDSTAALAVASQKRRGRGIWLLILVLVLAAVAGTTGWYFGVGPGSKVTIPQSIEGKTPVEAEAILRDLGFEVDDQTGTIDSPTVAADLVAQSDPAIGDAIAKGATVRLLISTGPKLIPFGDAIVRGMPVSDAEAAIEAAPWTLAGTVVQFDVEVPKDAVIDVLGSDAATSILGAESYGELQELTLVVSAGPVPDVSGKTLDEAIGLLSSVSVTATAGAEEYHDTIPAGNVIMIELAEGQVLHPDDQVTLQISRGPAPVDVPDITGWTWADAKAKLDELGFKCDYNQGADLAPQLVTVKSTDPNAGTTIHRGDTIKVKFT